MGNQIKHYRTISAETPFTLAELEAFCATLRAHNCDGDTCINANYKVTLNVRIDEPLLTPVQLKAL